MKNVEAVVIQILPKKKTNILERSKYIRNSEKKFKDKNILELHIYKRKYGKGIEMDD